MTNREFQARVLGCERRLYGVAYMLLNSAADCEDAVQEALLRAWRRLPSLREEAYFETWLARIVINECKQLMRKRVRRAESPLPETLPAPPPPNPELYRALRALDARHRIVLTLKYVDGYGVAEIARILRVPQGTVASRLSRARKMLKDRLEGGDIDENTPLL
ncbi:MAG: RNA polymerase sigma factor [Clostridiales bacterium]|nr:RNA polymerase sigma factor [Clostridiales bacterium]